MKKFDKKAIAAFKTLDKLHNASGIYPGISIMSENTRVWDRFCESDIVYRCRSQIGAPDGVKVYCLDGSLLLTEDD